MRFTCKTMNLREAIAKVERIVSKQTTLPILGNILISTEKGRLLIASTNLEIAVKVYIGAKIEEEGQVTIPARILGGFLNTIKDEVVSGDLKDLELKISSDNHKIKIKGIDAKDFPIIPDVEGESFFSVLSDVLIRIISGVLVSVAHNDTRQELNGVFVRFDKEKLTLASTDSFRLTELKVDIEKNSITKGYDAYREKKSTIIVPALALMELQRIAVSGEHVEFTIDQNQLFISTNSTKVISRLINGNYPEYKQVLPKTFEINVKLNKEEFIGAIKIASLVANSQNGEVQLKSSKDKKHLIVAAQSIDTGDNISKIPAEIDGVEFSVLFNCRYLLEGLGGVLFDGDFVLLKLNQQKSPVMLKSLNDERTEDTSFSYVIMPIIKS
ncbi:MAG: DNA polymerase III subunit beta [Patescibacteria group bacterium]|nr:DNA polymerase III subunit beta [Patescibacteria group bacterium]